VFNKRKTPSEPVKAYNTQADAMREQARAHLGYLMNGTPSPFAQAREAARGEMRAPDEVEIDEIVLPGPRQRDPLAGIVPLRGAAPAAAKPITVLKKGVYNNMDVKRLQTDLTDIAAFLRIPGVNPEGVDGDFGDNTADALKAYQTVMRLPVTGTADAATLSAIYDHRRNLSKGEGTDLRAGETNVGGRFGDESPLVKTDFSESSPYARPRG
jgi:hypothetical protein